MVRNDNEICVLCFCIQFGDAAGKVCNGCWQTVTAFHQFYVRVELAYHAHCNTANDDRKHVESIVVEAVDDERKPQTDSDAVEPELGDGRR